MELRNKFSDRVRLLWLDCWECQICKGNGTQSGGLELHHIIGRDSNSALNACLVCKGCHQTLGHSEKEEIQLFVEVLAYYYNQDAHLTKEDLLFIDQNERLQKALIAHKALQKWIREMRDRKS